MTRARSAVDALRSVAVPLDGSPRDLDHALELVGDARFVLIGEASHGTHEFYRVRAEITKRLIREKGFHAVALEADWPDAHRVHRFVHGRGDDANATEALAGFERFPQWMWRNADVLDFVGWLRGWNETCAKGRQVGFFGLDLYSLHRSMRAVVDYLRVVDPEAARRAEARYACFDAYGDDPQTYGQATALGASAGCERDVVMQLLDLRRKAAEYAQRDGRLDPDAQFLAEENARVVVHAERYYRTMFHGRVSSWNLRDEHMADALEAVAGYVARSRGTAARIVVWAHNSHLGDARATYMKSIGELNLGQLVRERHPRETVGIGFTTFHGTVTAARNWDSPAEHRIVRDALHGSWERALHALGGENWWVPLRGLPSFAREPLLERAIGVIYRPETERASHYFEADLPAQFDAIYHYDRTRAVEPLEPSAEWERGEMPETYPSTL